MFGVKMYIQPERRLLELFNNESVTQFNEEREKQRIETKNMQEAQHVYKLLSRKNGAISMSTDRVTLLNAILQEVSLVPARSYKSWALRC